MNQSDAERIRTVIEELGYERTEVEEEADLLGLVACSVRQKAIDRVYSRVAKWNEWKRKRPITTFASGCILPADRDKFADRFDLLFSISELPTLPQMIRQHGVVTAADTSFGRVGGDAHWGVAPRHESAFEAFVPIQNGCDKFCTFCAVPFTRGREISRASDEVLTEVERLVDAGYKSITLLGQNVNSYGTDRSSRGAERSFAELLAGVGEIGERVGARRGEEAPFWLYFTSPHPRDMGDDVIDTIARYPVLAKQIHLPLQSGDDKVLLRMNRGYHFQQYRRVVAKIRDTLPTATLFTDIIVGFTGETEDQFERTRAAMIEFEYDMAYIAIYSPRPGAKSARWEDDVPHEEKRRRLHELSSVLQESSLARNRALVGTTITVLVDGTDRKPGYLSAKSEGKLIVRFRGEENLIGRFVKVQITNAATLSMEGELVGVPHLV